MLPCRCPRHGEYRPKWSKIPYWQIWSWRRKASAASRFPMSQFPSDKNILFESWAYERLRPWNSHCQQSLYRFWRPATSSLGHRGQEHSRTSSGRRAATGSNLAARVLARRTELGGPRAFAWRCERTCSKTCWSKNIPATRTTRFAFWRGFAFSCCGPPAEESWQETASNCCSGRRNLKFFLFLVVFFCFLIFW